jgi:hypothetical protein
VTERVRMREINDDKGRRLVQIIRGQRVGGNAAGADGGTSSGVTTTLTTNGSAASSTRLR